MSITAQHTKEQLCNAHLTAIAARAGVNLHLGEGCDYGVDGQFRSVEIDGTRRRENGFGIDFQAKASVCWMISGSDIVFDLEAKTYNDLVSRSTAATAFIIVLLCLPRTAPAWHEVGHDETVLSTLGCRDGRYDSFGGCNRIRFSHARNARGYRNNRKEASAYIRKITERERSVCRCMSLWSYVPR